MAKFKVWQTSVAAGFISYYKTFLLQKLGHRGKITNKSK